MTASRCTNHQGKAKEPLSRRSNGAPETAQMGTGETGAAKLAVFKWIRDLVTWLEKEQNGDLTRSSCGCDLSFLTN